MEVVEEAGALHPAGTAHLPFFITPPGQTDWLLIAMMLLLVGAVIGIGVFYLKLHALPEHMAHRGQKLQYELVAVLGLLALFTHNHIFWIVGLPLAMIPIPDFITPITSMAHSLGRMADRVDGPVADPSPPTPAVPVPDERGSGHA